MAEIGKDIKAAAEFLQSTVIGLPTETVYGLAGNALDSARVADIFRIKQRPYFDPLIVHVPDAAAFPRVATPPSYLSSFPPTRPHPFVWAPNATNVTIRGGGVLDGGGPYWWSSPEAHQETRPHLVELYNVTRVEVTGVTLRNSAFWTFRPIYCADVWIHDMRIDTPYNTAAQAGGEPHPLHRRRHMGRGGDARQSENGRTG